METGCSWQQLKTASIWPRRQEGIPFPFFPLLHLLSAFLSERLYVWPCWIPDSTLLSYWQQLNNHGCHGERPMLRAYIQQRRSATAGPTEVLSPVEPSLWAHIMLSPQLCRGTKPLSIETIRYVKEWIMNKKLQKGAVETSSELHKVINVKSDFIYHLWKTLVQMVKRWKSSNSMT